MSKTRSDAESSSLIENVRRPEPAEVTASAATNRQTPEHVAFREPTCPPRLPEFDEDDHLRGLRMRMVAALSKIQVVFGVGKELSEGYAKLEGDKKPVKGRGSLYGKWLETYLPTFDRKTLDRWRLAYDKFSPLLDEEIRTRCLDFFDRFELSAVYALCRREVTDKQRRFAIEIALAGDAVNKKKVNAIVENPLKCQPSFYRKPISIPAGKVTIAINHPDFRQALKEALDLINDD